MLLIGSLQQGPSSTTRRFGTGYVCVALVALYQATVAVVRALNSGTPVLPASRFAWESGAGAVLLALLALTFWATVAGTGGLWAVPHVAHEDDLHQPLMSPTVCSALVSHNFHCQLGCYTYTLHPQVATPDLSPLVTLSHPHFWLLLTASTTVIGSGLLLLNNLTQLVLSLGGSVTTAAIAASLFSVCNCLGRLATGWGSEVLLHSKVCLMD